MWGEAIDLEIEFGTMGPKDPNTTLLPSRSRLHVKLLEKLKQPTRQKDPEKTWFSSLNLH